MGIFIFVAFIEFYSSVSFGILKPAPPSVEFYASLNRITVSADSESDVELVTKKIIITMKNEVGANTGAAVSFYRSDEVIFEDTRLKTPRVIFTAGATAAGEKLKFIWINIKLIGSIRPTVISSFQVTLKPEESINQFKLDLPKIERADGESEGEYLKISSSPWF